MHSHINRPAKKLVILIAPQSGPYSWLVIAPCCQVRGQMLTILLQHFLHSGEDSLPILVIDPWHGMVWLSPYTSTMLSTSACMQFSFSLEEVSYQPAGLSALMSEW